MDKETKNLYAFGYGLSLLIPFMITLRGIEHGLAWWMVLGLFFAILFLVTRMILVKPVWNVWVIAVQAYIVIFGVREHFGNVPLALLGLSVLIALATIIKAEWLHPLYTPFIKAAHFIGSVITGVFLAVLFYLVFGAAGIVLRLIGKDLLDRKIEPETQSYWINRKEGEFNKADYTRQF